MTTDNTIGLATYNHCRWYPASSVTCDVGESISEVVREGYKIYQKKNKYTKEKYTEKLYKS